MRRLAFPFCALALLACEPSTGGIKEADDDVADDSTGTADTESSSGADDICEVGSANCACTPGGGCDPGLECVEDMCTDPVSTSSESDSSGTTDETTDTGGCTELGCACEDVDGACDPGLVCEAGTCQMINLCGNGSLDLDEACDDSNLVDGDGCDADCSYTEVLGLAAGERHTCALIEGGRIRCWGEGLFGALGRGSLDNVGDNETPGSISDLPLPPNAVAIDAGEAHTCASFDDATLRCWGQNYYGQLGYANSMTVPLLGDDELIDMLAPVMVGGAELSSFALGGRHGCARLSDGKIRCWGGNAYGQLGLANLIVIGDDESPVDAPMMLLGATAEQIASGDNHNCVITMPGGYVRCWGRSNKGQLGYGNNLSIGDTESPADAGDLILVPASLPVDTQATALALGFEHSCVLFETGDVVCWGENSAGELAKGTNQDFGAAANETPSTLVPIDLGGPAVAIAAGHSHTCALLDDGTLRCWGENGKGQLGLGTTVDVGVNQSPAEAGAPDLGGLAVAVVTGGEHTCALLENNSVLCWGGNAKGQLGYGHIQSIGDTETPASVGPIELW